jgi:hypothetical protein
VSDLLLNGLAPTQTQLNGGVGTVTEGQDTVTQITGASSTTMNGTIPFDFGVMTGLSPGQQGGNTTSVSFTLSQPGGFTAQDFQNFLDTTAEYGFRLINVDIVNGNSLKVFGEPNPQLLPLEPFPEAFGYTEGAAVASAVDLGNKINNDIDPNAGGVISFSQLDTAVFEVPATPFLQSYVAGLTVVVSGPNTITITDSASHAATITVDALGEELISDPFNIFKPLNLGESIVLDVGYHIQDNLGLSAADSQTITISGTNQALVPTPEAFSYTEGAGSADLGNKISNDVDPNHGGVISFSQLDTAVFEVPATPFLQSYVAGLTVVVSGPNTITITDSASHAATITVDALGEELISDPFNIFKPLNLGESIVLDVGYHIQDNLGLSAADSQTITISGTNQALVPTPEAFSYTEGAGSADLGNKISNDVDPNHGGVISFSQLDTAVFEVPATPFLQSYVAGLTVVVSGPNTITITDSASHAATITVDALGEELISDPFNIFKPLNLGESIVLDVGYHIQDNLGLSAADSQTITISGTNQALVPTPEAFSYMEGAGSADLGNKISNDVDPNHDGVISFATLDTAHFETPSSSWLQTFVAGLTVTIQNHNPDGTPLVGDGNSNIVVTDTFGHKAYINISSSGEEFIVDPNNIFKPLETGDSLVLDVGYTIKDNLGLTALDSQTITIHGVTQGHPFTSDLSNLVLYLQNSAGAVEKVIFQNGAQLAFRTDSDIITWMDDHSSLLNGYTMLDAFTYHVGPNNELNKTLAADMRPNEGQLVLTPHGDINQITDTHYYSPSNFPGDTKQKLIIDLQNHSVDTLAQLVGTPLANGAHLHDGYALTINNSTII